MSKYTFSKKSQVKHSNLSVAEGVHVAVVVQVAHIGLQKPFDRGQDPEPQMAVAFELESGELLAKRMKFSDHPSSGCYAVFDAAFPDLDESDDQDLGLPALLDKTVMIEVEVRDEKWPRVTGIMPLEEGFKSFEPKTALLDFDADEMDREVYLKLHRDIRAWVSKRVRQP